MRFLQYSALLLGHARTGPFHESKLFFPLANSSTASCHPPYRGTNRLAAECVHTGICTCGCGSLLSWLVAAFQGAAQAGSSKSTRTRTRTRDRDRDRVSLELKVKLETGAGAPDGTYAINPILPFTPIHARSLTSETTASDHPPSTSSPQSYIRSSAKGRPFPTTIVTSCSVPLFSSHEAVFFLSSCLLQLLHQFDTTSFVLIASPHHQARHGNCPSSFAAVATPETV